MITDDTAASHTFKSIIAACIGFALFSVADVCVKRLGLNGYDSRVILLYSSFLASLMAIAYILITKRTILAFYPQKSPVLHLIRAVAMIFGTYFIVEALQKLQIAELYTFAFIIPFLVAMGGALCFGEKVGIYRWSAILAGFCGVMICVSGSLANPNALSLEGYIDALCMVVSITLSYLIIRQMGHGEYAPLFPLFAQGAIFLANSVYIALYPVTLPLPSPYEAFIFVIYGGCLFTAIMLVSKAYNIAPVAAIPAPFQYTQIVWGVLFGYIFFNEIPRDETFIGLAVIIAAGLFIVWREYKNSNLSQKGLDKS
jgi:drug/metabolite transporter (DMT)-like permease